MYQRRSAPACPSVPGHNFIRYCQPEQDGVPGSFVSEALVISVVTLNRVEAAVLFHAYNAKSVPLDAGHVGMLVGLGTVGGLWLRVRDWLTLHSNQ